MGLETANTIAELNALWPLGTDPKSQGDDHLRLIKKVIQSDTVVHNPTATQTIDGQDLVLTNGNLGVGTTNPVHPIDTAGIVRGDMFLFGANGTLPLGTSGIYRPENGVTAIGRNGTEYLRVNENGNLGVGTSSPNSKLEVYDTSGDTSITIKANSTYSNLLFRRNGSGGDVRVRSDVSNNTLELITNGSVSLHVDSNGHMILGGTTYGSGSGVHFGNPNSTQGGCLSIKTAANVGYHWRFGNITDGYVGSITTTATATAYNTTSDYRLKTDVQPITGAIDRLMALKPVNFAWKANGTRIDGFLAHEAQAVVPEAVMGEKDAVDEEGNPEYQGIDQSKLVPLLTKALQEAMERIETLEAKVTAMEGV